MLAAFGKSLTRSREFLERWPYFQEGTVRVVRAACGGLKFNWVQNSTKSSWSGDRG